MSRSIFDENKVHQAIKDKMGGEHRQLITEVEQAIEQHPVVIVGMAQNPFCKKVRKHLKDAGIRYHYIEHGSYFKSWQQRLTLKMWMGWPTFPMVFINGEFIGGCAETKNLIASGQLDTLLKAA